MKKFTAMMLVACLVLAMALTGCGSASSASTSTSNSTGGEGRTVTIVTAGTSLPYSLLNEDGTWEGIDAEVWAEIANRTGWTIELKQAAFDSIWGELDTNRADVSANCWAMKQERLDKYYGSIPYYGDAQSIVVPKDNTTIATHADLGEGMVVGVANGQASQTILEEMAATQGFEVKLYDDSAAALNDMNLGRIDAVGCAVTTANSVADGMGVEFKILDERLTANNVGYFFQKTEEGAALRDEVNVVLQEMLDDGTLAAITEKWLYADMTKLIFDQDI